MTATAKLFMHGRSQAVRLPKEFRMPGKEVLVSREGDRVVLQPKADVKDDPKAIFARIDALGGFDFLPEDLPDDPPVGSDDSITFD
jgi:antitoxin VapB